MVRGITVRRFRSSDLGFVERMIVAACFPPTHLLPTVDEARKSPHAARWLGPPIGVDDVVVLADGDAGRGPMGAAVGRRFDHADSARGVLAPEEPELALAVAGAYRGQGVGEALLRGWLAELHARGFGGASLTVSLRNEGASRLYARCGFREVARDERRIVMRVRTTTDGR